MSSSELAAAPAPTSFLENAEAAQPADDAPAEGVEDRRITSSAATKADHVSRARHDVRKVRKRGRLRSLLATARTSRGRVSIAMAAVAAVIVAVLVWSNTQSSSSSCEHDPQFSNLRYRSESCLGSYQQTGNEHDLALAASAFLALGKLDRADELAHQLLDGARRGDGYALLGQVALKRNEVRDATTYAVLASASHLSINDEPGLMADAMLLFQASWQSQDVAAALDATEEAAGLAHRLHDAHAEVTALFKRADVLCALGDVHGAEAALMNASGLATEPCDRAWSHLKNGMCVIEAGAEQLAMASFVAAEEANRACHDRGIADSVAFNEAWLLRETDPAGASAKLDAVSEERPGSLLLRSYLAADRGDLAGAQRHLERAEQLTPDASWTWRIAQAHAELSESRGSEGDDLDAELHYRRAIGAITALRATTGTPSSRFISSHRGPYDGLIALLARHARWNDVLTVVLQLEATALQAGRYVPGGADAGPRTGDLGAIAAAVPPVSAVVSAWRARDLVIAIAPSRRHITSGREHAYRIQVTDGRVCGDDIGDADRAAQLATALFNNPADRDAAGALGALMIPAGSETSTLHVLAIGALSRAPLAALRDATGSLIIARRPLTRVLALGAVKPPPATRGHSVIIGDPLGNLPGAAVERAIVARAVGPNALVAGAGTSIAATRSLLWSARDAELLHVAAPIFALGPSRTLRLSDGAVEPGEILRRGVAPRIAILTGNSSATMDDDGQGSFASALLEAGTEIVIATDRSVEDAVALSIMRDFYAQPDWQADPERALARVQVALETRDGASSGDALRAGAWAGFYALRRPPHIAPRSPSMAPAAPAHGSPIPPRVARPERRPVFERGD